MLSKIDKIEKELDCFVLDIFDLNQKNFISDLFDKYKFHLKCNEDILEYCIKYFINNKRNEFLHSPVRPNLFRIGFGPKNLFIYLELESESVFIPSNMSSISSDKVWDLLKTFDNKLQKCVDFCTYYNAYKDKPISMEEMIKFIKQYPYIKIINKCFCFNEFIYSKENGYVYDEYHYLFEDWNSESQYDGLRKRVFLPQGWCIKEILDKDKMEDY